MQDQLQELFRDWQTKHTALDELQTKFVAGRWMPDYDGEETTPASVQQDAGGAIREIQQAREAEQLAWQTLAQALIDLTVGVTAAQSD